MGVWEEPPDSIPPEQRLPGHSILIPVSDKPPEALSILGRHHGNPPANKISVLPTMSLSHPRRLIWSCDGSGAVSGQVNCLLPAKLRLVQTS